MVSEPFQNSIVFFLVSVIFLLLLLLSSFGHLVYYWLSFWAEIFFISVLLELLGLLFFCGSIWWGYISSFLVITGIMSTSNVDVFGVRFTGKNYSTWEFHFRIFVMGKEL